MPTRDVLWSNWRIVHSLFNPPLVLSYQLGFWTIKLLRNFQLTGGAIHESLKHGQYFAGSKLCRSDAGPLLLWSARIHWPRGDNILLWCWRRGSSNEKWKNVSPRCYAKLIFESFLVAELSNPHSVYIPSIQEQCFSHPSQTNRGLFITAPPTKED